MPNVNLCDNEFKIMNDTYGYKSKDYDNMYFWEYQMCINDRTTGFLTSHKNEIESYKTMWDTKTITNQTFYRYCARAKSNEDICKYIVKLLEQTSKDCELKHKCIEIINSYKPTYEYLNTLLKSGVLFKKCLDITTSKLEFIEYVFALFNKLASRLIHDVVASEIPILYNDDYEDFQRGYDRGVYKQLPAEVCYMYVHRRKSTEYIFSMLQKTIIFHMKLLDVTLSSLDEDMFSRPITYDFDNKYEYDYDNVYTYNYNNISYDIMSMEHFLLLEVQKLKPDSEYIRYYLNALTMCELLKCSIDLLNYFKGTYYYIHLDNKSKFTLSKSHRMCWEF